MARGSTARMGYKARHARPPVADVRVTRPDGTTEVFTFPAWKREAKARKDARAEA